MASVKQAIKESVEAFVRGVYSHGPANPDVTIPDDVIKWLKDDENVYESFAELIGADPERWKGDGPRVCRAAFHAGSLAALHAYSKKGPKVVDRVNARDALEHISTICKAGIRVEYRYCRLLPTPS